MNEQELGKKIAKLLDCSADENIKQSVLYRLQSARRAALENYQPATLKIMNSGGSASVFGGHGWHFTSAKLLLLLTVLFILMNIAYSQFLDDKYAAIDTMILADDLPIDAYIDNEFDEWLNAE